jgi:hypothetical protein
MIKRQERHEHSSLLSRTRVTKKKRLIILITGLLVPGPKVASLVGVAELLTNQPVLTVIEHYFSSSLMKEPININI